MVQCVDQNYLRSNRFQVNIPHAPILSQFVQDVTLPGIQMGEAMHPTTLFDLGEVGDKITFDMFDVTFVVQENFQNYMEIYEWFMRCANPEAFDEDRVADKDYKSLKCDIIVMIHDNNNQPRFVWTMHDAHPIMISPLNFTVREEAQISASCTFRFSTFDIKPAI